MFRKSDYGSYIDITRFRNHFCLGCDTFTGFIDRVYSQRVRYYPGSNDHEPDNFQWHCDLCYNSNS